MIRSTAPEEVAVRRAAMIPILISLALAACGGGEVLYDTTIPGPGTSAAADEISPTGEAASASSEIVLSRANAGSRVQAVVGDTIVVRLPEDDPGADPWILARRPDPLVLGTGDVFLWIPSEPDAGAAYAEFVFFVLGPGTTSVLFSRGQTTPTTPTLEYTIEATTG